VPSEYPTIQLAVDVASPGDSVLVAPGTYTECDGGDCLPAVVRLREGVTVISEDGPEMTVLRAADLPNWSVVDARGLGAEGASLVGFTVTSDDNSTGGVSGLGALRLDVVDCVFTGVRVGIAVNTQFGDSLYVKGCVFRDCGRPDSESGIKSFDIDVEIIECLFEGGTGTNVVSCTGWSLNTSFVMKDCIVQNNSATAVAVIDFRDALVERCQFVNSEKQLLVGGGPCCPTGSFVTACS
jgi:hypothetical protein